MNYLKLRVLPDHFAQIAEMNKTLSVEVNNRYW